MNANTGETYMLRESIVGTAPIGSRVAIDAFEQIPVADLTQDELLAAVALARDEAIIRVEGKVAQQLQVGQRELARRARRRRT